ncbi:MAG: hypothetical protein HAW67_06185 [Endozoicomonadaceae bacterium]|nr:hypothetical protein [Endozoicomonadaceae bacterium]
MIFNKHLLDHFLAASGAGSIVTDREATGDKSVTIDKMEKSVLFPLYSDDSFTRAGGAAPDGNPSHWNFKVLDPKTGIYQQHEIAVKYPKSGKNELRLYFNRKSNFYPFAEDYWYIFSRKNEDIPYIGSISKGEWDNISSGLDGAKAFEANYSLDEDDEQYQKELHSPQAQAGKVEISSTRYHRNPSKAANAVKKSKYKCQYNNEHISFIAGASSKQYVEVHHLIPLSCTKLFDVSLDVSANLVVLCPNCHKAIHLGTAGTKIKYLERLFAERKDALSKSGIDINFKDLCKLYSV